ncbi:LPXTG cell wall anchor domain-containing protein [Arthrobacter sp. zg-Y859]|uniref:LPXTG cell wall anchor domain-containing protein n=1 Tax=Arthrobacter jinronghuae TaxID=2964609 RepID=A0ABT1NLK6_9MICC|nr:trypsin-like serine protease [Arthrobacter jinronghuae]MCQ1948608.1 LPXTG cell wall anchor domain-containing protein [Arthrobacter jinronghuae]UWX78577.1 LPXTG cell wall anchor domain-containing protein [Arthrobacter jinronghuae]
MQESSRPLYARVGALSAAALLAVSGAFIAGPAMADTGDTPQPTTTETPAAPLLQGTGELAPGLEEALQRDLGMTVDEFVAAGELSQKASAALAQLRATKGFVNIEIRDNGLVVTGSGEELEALAAELDATVVEPAAPAEAPSLQAPIELLTQAPEAPAADETETAVVEGGASEPEAKQATDLQDLLSAYASAVGTENLRSVSGSPERGFTIDLGDPFAIEGTPSAARTAPAMSPEEFDKQYTNVKLNPNQPEVKPKADDTVVGGAGYYSEVGSSRYSCSVGYTGYNASGAEAIITAGHCADGAGSQTFLEVTTDEFGTGEELGTFGSWSHDGTAEAPGTDIAVIDNINTELDLRAETANWENTEDLSATTVKLKGTTSPVVGAPICKSGRTTNWDCGTITELGIASVSGVWVHGFFTDVFVDGGDSGGAMISGEYGVGITSGGADNEPISFAADLDTALASVPGYTVGIHLDAPALTSPANNGTVDTDAVITGTAPAGSTVNVTIDGEDAKAETAADGTWTIKAPTLVPADEKITITAQAVNGYNKSSVSEFELTVKEAPLPAPVFTTPATVLHSIETIEGTGVAGATVALTVPGDAEEEDVATAAVLDTEVDDEGNWSVTLEEPLTYGVYELSAVQGGIDGKEESGAATLNLTVAPDAPVITSPTDGQEFVEGSLPNEITGTGTAGVEVTVAIDGKALEAVVVDEDGNWSVPMGDLTAGDYGITAAQTINSAPSADAFAGITVTAAPVVVDPAPAANPGGGLPDTGAANLGLLAGGGASLLAAGAAALMYNKRRRVSVDA